MGMLGGYCNQTAQLQTRTGKDGFNKPTFSATRTIRVRKDPATGVRRSATGTDVDAESYYLTEAVVSVEDRLDGLPVRRVEDVINKGGKRLGCEVWV